MSQQRRGATLPNAEAALEAWVECRPEGMRLPLERLPSLLPNIAVRVPKGLDTPDAARRLNELFNSKVPGGEEPPPFLAMARPCDGQVHFLGFWRAFAEAARLVAGVPPTTPGLESELDALQDTVLRLFEASPTPEGCPEDSMRRRRITAKQFAEGLRKVMERSSVPEFWRAVAGSVMGLEDESRELGHEDVAVIMLSWLHDPEVALPPPPATASSSGSNSPRGVGQEVFLNVYDVSQEESVQKLNRVLAHKYSPVKFGGVFHAGVEVNGLEWSYGFSACETVPGVSCTLPREHPQHHFRQTVCLRRTKLSREDVAEIISALIEEYPGDDYDLLRRNCCHFADDFCQRLGVGRIPGWVHRLARIGARLDGALQVAQGLHERFRGVLLPEEEEGQEDADVQVLPLRVDARVAH